MASTQLGFVQQSSRNPFFLWIFAKSSVTFLHRTRAIEFLSRNFLAFPTHFFIYAGNTFLQQSCQSRSPSEVGATHKSRTCNRHLHIRHLELSFEECDDGPDDFLCALQHLTKAESLTITHGDILDWRAMLWPVRNALLRLMYLPTLTALTLCRVDKFLIVDLVHAANLRCLKFLNVYSTSFFEDSTDVAAPVAPMILPEKSLQFRQLLFD